MMLVPKKFFVTSGKATSAVSDLNAFDVALIEAGISEQNLVAVSSVIPANAVMTEKTKMEMGAVTHCVLSQIRGKDGEIVSAGIAYAFRKDGQGGYVAEGHLHGSSKDLDIELRNKMNEMARIRGIELQDITILTKDLDIPMKMYGCCVVGLIFTEYQR